MAHGYFKIEGKPLGVLAHGTVGLQHASMAIYNAYCDRVPVYIVLGNTLDATMRQPGVEWLHSVQDAAAMVRDYIKWDDTPASLQHFARIGGARVQDRDDAAARCPVVIVADSELQERPCRRQERTARSEAHARRAAAGRFRRRRGAGAPAGRRRATRCSIADKLARTAGRHAASRSSSPSCCRRRSSTRSGRMNFPVAASAEPHRRERERSSARRTSSSASKLPTSAALLHALSRSAAPHVPAADQGRCEAGQHHRRRSVSEVQLPGLSALSRSRCRHRRRCGSDAAVAHRSGQAADHRRSPAGVSGTRHASWPPRSRAAFERARADAAIRRGTHSPISTARAAAELWAQIRNEDWSLVLGVRSLVCGWSGGRSGCGSSRSTTITSAAPAAAGIGYGAPATVGAALANRKHGRLSVSIQNDGDLMYGAGRALDRGAPPIPLLIVMNNNRGVSRGSDAPAADGRPPQSRHRPRSVGTTMENPAIDFAKLAQSLGVYAEGPISNPRISDRPSSARLTREARRAGASGYGHAAALRRPCEESL